MYLEHDSSKKAKSMKNTPVCENCGSQHMQNTPEGFVVCADCGMQQTEKAFTSHLNMYKPLHREEFSHLSRTRIGLPTERKVNPKFVKLQNRNLKFCNTYNAQYYRRVYIEIRRICSALSLPLNLPADAFAVFKKVVRKIPLKSSAKGIDTISPIVIYRTAQELGVAINLIELSEVMRCSADKFKTALVDTYNDFPAVDKMKAVADFIQKTWYEMDMEPKILERALEILRANKLMLLSSTNSVGGCTALALAVITLKVKSDYPLYKIGKNRHASASAISSRMFKVLKHRNLDVPMRVSKLEKALDGKYSELIS
ncbi:MAG: hypothetical protein GF364_06220 [Candidatus Lokiarchaeota archaeon]|nr:hypothetical protein [Candidatus Lokiarchaeota archaeon]